MLAEHRQYLLPGGKGYHLDVKVIPTGFVEVEIMEEHDKFLAEFEELSFLSNGKKTELVCRDHVGGECVRWQVDLASDDARELAKLIELAEDEFELLMRDL
ncbi:hypothetical protein L6J37_20075 [Photobacterium sp. WH77]|uniref:hypothetical protein n=1 Tax=unclassified Photobacterium TaxID=2628852 RepID=UPI001EDA7D66|nr:MULTISPECIES: hypothetical protein [unclassified Photobacterium]MCG2839136.1 hypothetical protein [Photobacterium sp. WH77]MCG2846721.1 hypothetical protein [Photobacterium sp. WH80]